MGSFQVEINETRCPGHLGALRGGPQELIQYDQSSSQPAPQACFRPTCESETTTNQRLSVNGRTDCETPWWSHWTRSVTLSWWIWLPLWGIEPYALASRTCTQLPCRCCWNWQFGTVFVSSVLWAILVLLSDAITRLDVASHIDAAFRLCITGAIVMTGAIMMCTSNHVRPQQYRFLLVFLVFLLQIQGADEKINKQP